MAIEIQQIEMEPDRLGEGRCGILRTKCCIGSIFSAAGFAASIRRPAGSGTGRFPT